MHYFNSNNLQNLVISKHITRTSIITSYAWCVLLKKAKKLVNTKNHVLLGSVYKSDIYHLSTSQLFEDINTWQETAAFEFSYKNNEQQRQNTKNEQVHKIINKSLKLQPNGNVHAQFYNTSPTTYFQLWVKKEYKIHP